MKPSTDPTLIDMQNDICNSSHEQVPMNTLRAKYRHLINHRHNIISDDVEHFCKLVDQHIGTSGKTAYRALRAIVYKPHCNTTVAADNSEERLQKIRAKCLEQLNNPIGDPNIRFQPHEEPHSEFNIGPFTSEELATALQHTPRGKAPGPDGVLTDLLKITELQPALLNLLNDCWTTNTVPELFLRTRFAMIPKPGADHKKPEGWRYIALMSATAKIYDKMILARLSSVIEPNLRQQQNGFRPQRGTIQHCMALRHVIDEIDRTETPAILTFIDFSNAFPSVSWASIRAALAAFNVPQQLISAVMLMYNNHLAYVETPEGPTPNFSPTAGVLQGDTLAPFLFLLVLNEVLRVALADELGFELRKPFREQSQRAHVKGVHICDLDYADDIVLVAHTVAQAQRILGKLAAAAKTVGLLLNVKKTQHIRFYTPSTPELTLDGKQIASVNDYRYLGVWTDIDKDLNIRVGQAWTEHMKYSNVWHSTNVSDKTKVHLWRTMISPILLYGAPTYPETPQRYNKLRGTCTRMLRSALNLPFDAHATLSDLYGRGFVEKDNSTHDLPQLTTTIFVRQGMILQNLLRGPQQPLQEVLQMKLEPQHKNPTRATLVATPR